MSKLCTRCGRLRALPDAEWCWECSSEEEKERWWKHIRTKWVDEFRTSAEEEWEDLRNQKRRVIDETGYFPEGRWFILCAHDEIIPGEVGPGTKLSLSHVRGMNFETELRDVEMQGCLIENTVFKGDLYNVDFSGSTILNSEFDEVETINGVQFVDVCLRDVNLWGTIFNNVNLSSARLIKVNLNNSVFNKTIFTQTLLKEVEFRDVTLEPSPGPNCALRKDNFADINGIRDEPEYLYKIYEELMAYWSRLGYARDAEWARIKFLDALRRKEWRASKLRSLELQFYKCSTRYATSLSRLLLIFIAFSIIPFLLIFWAEKSLGNSLILLIQGFLGNVPRGSIALTLAGLCEALIGYLVLGLLIATLFRKMERA